LVESRLRGFVEVNAVDWHFTGAALRRAPRARVSSGILKSISRHRTALELREEVEPLRRELAGETLNDPTQFLCPSFLRCHGDLASRKSPCSERHGAAKRARPSYHRLERAGWTRTSSGHRRRAPDTEPAAATSSPAASTNSAAHCGYVGATTDPVTTLN